MTLDSLTADLAASAVADLQAKTPRAKQRRLSAADLVSLFDTVRADLAAAGDDDIAGEAVVYGGFVPNSYRGAAESDIGRVSLTRKDGAWDATFTLDRERAQIRPGGKGAEIVVRLKRAGQSRGRVV